MQDSMKKLGFCFENNPKYAKFFRLKIVQLVLHSIIALVSGVLIVNKSDTCSVPISIFLLGIFGTTISAVILNFFMCTGRCCEYFGTDDYKRPFKRCMHGLNLIYFPLYAVFCVIEFIWYVLGAYWYSLGGDCDKEFSAGYNATIGLAAFYFILLLIYIVSFCVFLCYIRSTDVPQPKPPEEPQKPPDNPANPADNTLGNPPDQRQGDHSYAPNYLGHDPGFNPRYDPAYNPRYDQRHFLENQPRFDPGQDPGFVPRNNPRDDHGYDPRFNQEFNPGVDHRQNPGYDSRFQPGYENQSDPNVGPNNPQFGRRNDEFNNHSTGPAYDSRYDSRFHPADDQSNYGYNNRRNDQPY